MNRRNPNDFVQVFLKPDSTDGTYYSVYTYHVSVAQVECGYMTFWPRRPFTFTCPTYRNDMRITDVSVIKEAVGHLIFRWDQSLKLTAWFCFYVKDFIICF